MRCAFFYLRAFAHLAPSTFRLSFWLRRRMINRQVSWLRVYPDILIVCCFLNFPMGSLLLPFCFCVFLCLLEFIYWFCYSHRSDSIDWFSRIFVKKVKTHASHCKFWTLTLAGTRRNYICRKGLKKWTNLTSPFGWQVARCECQHFSSEIWCIWNLRSKYWMRSIPLCAATYGTALKGT